MTVLELYQRMIKPLPAARRFQLARHILNEIPPQAVVDYQENWMEVDYRDFSQASWEYINRAVEQGERI